MSAPIENYINSQKEWTPVINLLREIALTTPLEENLKWGVPVYGFGKKNLIGLAAFKHHCAVWFYQGALINDKAGKFNFDSENEGRAMRQWRFKNLTEVEDNAELIQQYMFEAIANHKEGKEFKAPQKEATPMPEELKEALANDKNLNTAFAKAKVGRQKEFIHHIVQAKRQETRQIRLEKVIQCLKNGTGLFEHYQKL